MKRIFPLFILFFLLTNRPVFAYNINTFPLNDLGDRILKIQNQNFNFPPEITPLVLMQPNGLRLYQLTTSWSFLCTSTDNILNSSVSSPLITLPQNCQLITKPDVYDYIDGTTTNIRVKNPLTIDSVNDLTLDWKRTYDGVLSLHLLNNKLIGVRHNENVNHEYPPSWTDVNIAAIFSNTVQDTVPATTPYIDNAYHYSWPTGCRSGYGIPHYKPNGEPAFTATSYDQCWDSFQNFVSLVQIDTNNGNWQPNPTIKRPEQDTRIHDQGPIIWPADNYRGVYDGQGNMTTWRTGGFYQPTSLINGDYIYTFFKIGKYGGYCTGSARAPLSSNGDARSWKYYNRSRNAYDVPTLPSGFTKETIRNFYTTKTGYKSDCIVDEAGQPQYFNVAKLNNTPLFVATEERSVLETNTWKMGIRLSSDMVNWSEMKILSTCTIDNNWGWGCGQFAYPTFYNKNATGNYDIDPDEFYILGTHATAQSNGYELNAKKLSLTCTSVDTPTNLTAIKDGNTNNIRISWNEIPNSAFYSLRVNDLTNGWNGSCDNPNGNDFCKDTTTPQFSFTGIPGHQYQIWLHTRNYCGGYGSSSIVITFTLNNPSPTPTPSPSPSFTVSDLKNLLKIYLTNQDSIYKPVDQKVNILDGGYVIKWIK